MSAEELSLAEAIEAVRTELCKAQEQGQGSEVRFAVGPVELEFALDVRKTGGGSASVKVLGVLDLSGNGEYSTTNAHRVKIKLSPLGRDGNPLKVAADLPRRPD
jgi:hypothetical protein